MDFNIAADARTGTRATKLFTPVKLTLL